MTTFANRPLENIVKEAPVIVHGHVGESFSDYDPNGSGRIFTYTHVNVDEVLKGSVNANEITVRQPGGAKNGTALEVPGAARFTQGEEVVLLMSTANTKDQSYDIPGLASGKYMVQEAENGEQVLVSAVAFEEGKSTQVSLNDFRKLAKNEASALGKQMQFQAASTATPAPTPDASNQTQTSAEPSVDSAPVTPASHTTSYLLLILAAVAVFIARWWKRR